MIGTNPASTHLGNLGSGISLLSGAAKNTIGDTAPGLANTIAFNHVDGVAIDGPATTGVAVRGNSIHDNVGLSLHLTNNGDDNLAAPVITSFVPGLPTTVTGFLNLGISAATTVFTLDFYANSGPAAGAPGQGQVYLGSFTTVTDANGNAFFTATLSASTSAGQVVSATATKTDAAAPPSPANGDTTPFAGNVGIAGYHNTNPGVTLTGPANVGAGAPVSLTSTLSDTTKGKTYTYAWSVSRAGRPLVRPAGRDRHRRAVAGLRPADARHLRRHPPRHRQPGRLDHRHADPRRPRARPRRRHQGRARRPHRAQHPGEPDQRRRGADGGQADFLRLVGDNQQRPALFPAAGHRDHRPQLRLHPDRQRPVRDRPDRARQRPAGPTVPASSSSSPPRARAPPSTTCRPPASRGRRSWPRAPATRT